MVNGVTDINYKELLSKYMSLVKLNEGCTFAEPGDIGISGDYSDFGLTEQEAKELNRISLEISERGFLE